jgi:hypothetical protein
MIMAMTTPMNIVIENKFWHQTNKEINSMTMFIMILIAQIWSKSDEFYLDINILLSDT